MQLTLEGALLCATMPLVEIPSSQNEAPGRRRCLAGVLDVRQGNKHVSLGTTTNKQTNRKINKYAPITAHS